MEEGLLYFWGAAIVYFLLIQEDWRDKPDRGKEDEDKSPSDE